MAQATAIDIHGLTKTFGAFTALDDLSLTVRPGEMVALIGASGSGKSTLIRHIAGLVAADPKGAGRIEVSGGTVQANGRVSPDIRARRAEIGVVFQQFNLVGRLSLLGNVCLGALGRLPRWRGNLGLFPKTEKLGAMRALDRVGMAPYAGQRASTLSGGQQQRGAVARALVQGARVLLADEPIASLDPRSARAVMETMARLNAEDGITTLVALHQVDYAMRYCPRTVAMRAGRVVYDGPSAELTPALLRDLYGENCDEVILGSAASLDERPHALPERHQTDELVDMPVALRRTA